VKKDPFYAQLTDSVNTTDNPVFHKERRKIWDFAMKECESRCSDAQVQDSLLNHITGRLRTYCGGIHHRFTRRNRQVAGSACVSKPLTKYFNYDAISALGFGNSTRFLEGESTEVVKRVFGAIERRIVAIGYCSTFLIY
jgi:hypothetical protein